MKKTCLDCSHKTMCSVFKTIGIVRFELNQMLDLNFKSFVPDITPTEEIWNHIGSRCHFYADNIHEQKHIVDTQEHDGDFDIIECKKCGKRSNVNEDVFFIDGDKDTITCVSCGYEFTMSYPCPNCHEESADSLMWDETGIFVECKTCGTTYQPFGKKE